VPGTQEVARVGTAGFPASGIGGDRKQSPGRGLGRAYRLGAKRVIRSGYGIYYSAPTLDINAESGVKSAGVHRVRVLE
jgi:hypothetical protein